MPGVSSDLREDACFCDQGNLDITDQRRTPELRQLAAGWRFERQHLQQLHAGDHAVPGCDPGNQRSSRAATPAEWARNGGGLVNVVTKAGRNRFSGSAYEFLRNDRLNANSFFRNMDPSGADQQHTTSAAVQQLRLLRWVDRRFQPARTCFSSFSGDWRRSTRAKGTAGLAVPDPTLADGPGESKLCPARSARPECGETARSLAGTKRARDQFVPRPITNALDTRQQFVRVDCNSQQRTGRLAVAICMTVWIHLVSTARADLEAGHRYRSGHLGVLEARHIGGRLLSRSTPISCRQTACHEWIGPTHETELGTGNTRAVSGERGGARAEYLRVRSLEPRDMVAAVSARLSEPHVQLSSFTFQRETHTLKAGVLMAVEHSDSNLDPMHNPGELLRSEPEAGFSAFQNFLRGNPQGACGAACRYYGDGYRRCEPFPVWPLRSVRAGYVANSAEPHARSRAPLRFLSAADRCQ